MLLHSLVLLILLPRPLQLLPLPPIQIVEQKLVMPLHPLLLQLPQPLQQRRPPPSGLQSSWNRIVPAVTFDHLDLER